MSAHLFDEFPKISARQWKQKIQMDLKGEPYETLITRMPEGIDMRPFYHRDEYLSLPDTSFPRDFYIVSSLREPASVEAVDRILDRETGLVEVNLPTPLNPADLEKYRDRIYLNASLDRIDEARLWLDAGYKVFFAPLTDFTRLGNWSVREPWDEVLKILLNTYPNAFVRAGGDLFADSGANLAQQIAYTLAQVNEYLRRLDAGHLHQIRLDTAVGSRYLAEIAKLRALRFLWEDQHASPAWIRSRPALRNKSFLDAYTNMLRTGMEVMAAMQGGSDEIANLPYDYFTADNPDSQRLADNQLILLREEARMEGLHASRGSYFFDEMSYRMAAKARDILEQIEKGGGYLRQLQKGTIQSQIARSAAAEQEKFDRGEIILIGVNAYPNPADRPGRPLPRAFALRRSGKTLIRPVMPKRLAEKIEKEYLKKAED